MLVKPSGLRLLFISSSLITDSISLPVINWLKFSIFSCFSFSSLYASRNLSISPRLSNMLAYIFSYYSLKIAYISVVLVVISPLLFAIFVYLKPLSVFCFKWIWPERFIHFIGLFKEPSAVPHKIRTRITLLSSNHTTTRYLLQKYKNTN